MEPYFENPFATLFNCDVRAGLAALPNNSVDCVVTSPPYWSLRAYGTEPQVWPDGWCGELGLEPTFAIFLEHLTGIFEEVRRILKPTGTLWLNMGDSYSCSPNGRSAAETKAAGNDDRTFRDKPATDQHLPAKNLIGQPWRLAFALQEAGWWLRSDCIWWKRNAMPSSVEDRPGLDHEYAFLLTKSPRYYWDGWAVRERSNRPNGGSVKGTRGEQGYNIASISQNNRDNSGGYPRGEWRNLRTVWDILPSPSREAHYASFPRALPNRCILAGSSEHGCCSACGKPWERITRKSGGLTDKGWHEHESGIEQGSSAIFRAAPNGPSDYRVESLGWRKPCRCATEERVPATVLDIFAGTGTTLHVAIELGRRAIGIELHPKYAKIARKRILGARIALPLEDPETALCVDSNAPSAGPRPIQGALF